MVHTYCRAFPATYIILINESNQVRLCYVIVNQNIIKNFSYLYFTYTYTYIFVKKGIEKEAPESAPSLALSQCEKKFLKSASFSERSVNIK